MPSDDTSQLEPAEESPNDPESPNQIQTGSADAQSDPPSPPDPKHQPEFIVVGIGASAGGLAALKTFFSHVEEDSGMAYVVVVHLSPEHESHMADLLQPHGKIPVHQVTETTEMRPNAAYVIPPDANLSSIDTHLRLSALESERRRRSPIDHFFRTLAHTHGQKAVGLIMTGTGSDGVIGLARIREAGGFTVVQHPDEAEFNGMPTAAVAAGQVDRVLSLAEMPRYLQAFRDICQKLQVPEAVDKISQDDKEIIRKIINLIRSQTGNDFSQYKLSTILRRIRRRMQLVQVDTLKGYLRFLRTESGEIHRLFNDFLITVTNFFRDPEAWAVLEKEIIPELLKECSEENALRVWSVGCATGEEAYSLAILLLEAVGELSEPPQVQIFASDLHGESLDRAREGFFTQDISGDMSRQRLERWFVKESNGYRIRKEVRDTVVFAPHNLLKDPPFSKLDLIACRNLLIYVQREIQTEILEIFHYALKPNRFLFLGNSENVEKLELFRPHKKRHRLFVRNNFGSEKPHFPSLTFRGSAVTGSDVEREAPEKTQIPFGKLHEEMVERYGPPSVLLTENHEIIHYSRNAGRYLQQPGGEPTQNVFKRVRKELRVELYATLYALREDTHSTRSKPVPVNIDGGSRHIVLRACRAQFDDDKGYYLVFFDEMEVYEDLELTGEVTDEAYERLENELHITKQRLQSVTEEHETSEEEMRASHEEVQSVNEELRSTLEELETSKEELQSINEELITVNQENRNKVEELSQLSNDLQNLLSATDIATLFLDRNLRIMRYTPKLGELFNVKPTDRGRSLSDFTHRLGYDGFVADAREVLNNLQYKEQEVQSQDGLWFLMRILPYRTEQDRIEGVVITFVEISQVKNAEQNLREALRDLEKQQEKLRALNETLEERVAERTREVRTLAQTLTEAEQAERGRIAQILHDDLQQILCAIQTKFYLIQADLNKLEESESVEDFSEVRDWLQQGIDMTRQLTVELNPPVLKNEGMVAVLNWLANQVQSMHKLRVSVTSRTGEISLPEKTRILIFQVVRELLLNVVKHADVEEAEIICDYEDHQVIVEVVDNGCGFDLQDMDSESQEGSGFGLQSIRERLRFFGGDLHIQSAPGEGSRMKILAPGNGNS